MKRYARLQFLKLLRAHATPRDIAFGFACGVIVSFTPFFGLHLLGAAGLAILGRGNIAAALIGTVVGNPLTFPIIAWLSMAVGYAIMGVLFGHEAELAEAAGVWIAIEGFFGGLWGLIVDVATFDAGLDSVAAFYGGTRDFVFSVIAPYTIGGLVVGLGPTLLSYWLVLGAVKAYKGRIAAAKARSAARRLRAESTAES